MSGLRLSERRVQKHNHKSTHKLGEPGCKSQGDTTATRSVASTSSLSVIADYSFLILSRISISGGLWSPFFRNHKDTFIYRRSSLTGCEDEFTLAAVLALVVGDFDASVDYERRARFECFSNGGQ
jgi:hypothetical protein